MKFVRSVLKDLFEPILKDSLRTKDYSLPIKLQYKINIHNNISVLSCTVWWSEASQNEWWWRGRGHHWCHQEVALLIYLKTPRGDKTISQQFTRVIWQTPPPPWFIITAEVFLCVSVWSIKIKGGLLLFVERTFTLPTTTHHRCPCSLLPLSPSLKTH